jgi:hypothetical protein
MMGHPTNPYGVIGSTGVNRSAPQEMQQIGWDYADALILHSARMERALIIAHVEEMAGSPEGETQ